MARSQVAPLSPSPAPEAAPPRELVTVTAPPDLRSSAITDDAPLPPGTTVGRYVISGLLGRGGMSTVYRAEDPMLRRQVALKLLRADLSRHLTTRERFTREGQAMARLAHPHVAVVFDVGHHHEQVFLALELLEGGTLGTWARPGRPWREVHRMMMAAAQGLVAAHAAGIVHRDFKPDNVLLTGDGVPRVSDFGLAGSPRAPRPAGAPALTIPGTVVGTLAYMAPEQRDGRVADERADQYSLCLVWLEALGRDRTTPRSDLGGARGPRGLVRLLLRGLEPDPAHRWPSVTHLLAAIDRSRRSRRVSLAVAPLVALGAIGVVAAGGARSSSASQAATQPTVLATRKPTDGPWRMRLAGDGRTLVQSSSDRQQLWLEDRVTRTREALALPPGRIAVRADALAGVSRTGEVVVVRMEDRSVWRTGRGVGQPVLLRARGNGPVCLHPSGTRVAINAIDRTTPIEIRAVDDGRVLATAPSADLCTWAGDRLVLGWRPDAGAVPLQVVEPDGRVRDLPPLPGFLGDLASDGEDLWVAHTVGVGHDEVGRITRVSLTGRRAPEVVTMGQGTKFGPLAATEAGLTSARVSELQGLMTTALPATGGAGPWSPLDTGSIRDGNAEWLTPTELVYLREGRLLRHRLDGAAATGRITPLPTTAAPIGRLLTQVGDEAIVTTTSAAGEDCELVAVAPAATRRLGRVSCGRNVSLTCAPRGRCVLGQASGELVTYGGLDVATGEPSAPVLTLPLTASPHVDLADDGRWLVEAGGALSVFDPGTGQQTPIAAGFNADDARWSHDGSYVVAVGERDGAYETVRVDKGGAITTLARSPGTSYLSPRVSPDGQRLAVRTLERPFEYVLFPR